VLSSAKRELFEEAGVSASLWLCGTVIIDAGETGICMFVFCGENVQGEIKTSAEGIVEWVPKAALSHLPVVGDLPILLDRIDQMKPGDPPFFARSFYEDEKITLVFES
jgi:8-oxo-dGTP pyrophosphatase MutT (NUDIX family)